MGAPLVKEPLLVVCRLHAPRTISSPSGKKAIGDVQETRRVPPCGTTLAINIEDEGVDVRGLVSLPHGDPVQL